MDGHSWRSARIEYRAPPASLDRGAPNEGAKLMEGWEGHGGVNIFFFALCGLAPSADVLPSRQASGEMDEAELSPAPVVDRGR
jgi:hypothetical protein